MKNPNDTHDTRYAIRVVLCLFLNKVDSFQPLFFNICLSIRKKLTRSTGKS